MAIARQIIERLAPGDGPAGAVAPGLTVELAHAANPDIGSGGYWEGEPDENEMVVPVQSLADAARACRAFIDKHGLGGGNWTGGTVRKDGQVVARISYNGRAWTPEPYPQAKEIPLNTEL